MRRRGVEVVVQFLDVLAVISLRAAETEEAFLEDGVVMIPECQGKAQTALPVRDAEDSVFSPAVGARPRVVVRKTPPHI